MNKQVEQIKAEIERRRRDAEQQRHARSWGKSYYVMMSELLDIIANLPQEQPSQDLLKAAEEWYDKCPFQKSTWWEKDEVVKLADSEVTFIAGAQWQKEQDDELLTIAHLDGVACGRKKEREQMMKWSEEDEHRQTDAIYFLETAKTHYADTSEIESTISWLKSIKDRFKEDEK